MFLRKNKSPLKTAAWVIASMSFVWAWSFAYIGRDIAKATEESAETTTTLTATSTDKDFYFEVSSSQMLTVRTYAWESAQIDSMLWLYDSSNTLLAANDDYFGLDSYISINLQSGTYRLRAGVCCGNPDAWYGTSYTIEANTTPTNIPTTTTTTTTIPPERNIVWGSANEGSNLTLIAPAGKVFDDVIFASYGTPQGSDGDYSLGDCHASTSESIVSSVALGFNSVTIASNNSIFGDPCGGVYKRLYVALSYGDEPTTTTTIPSATTTVPESTTTTTVPETTTTTVPATTTTTTVVPETTVAPPQTTIAPSTTTTEPPPPPTTVFVPVQTTIPEETSTTTTTVELPEEPSSTTSTTAAVAPSSTTLPKVPVMPDLSTRPTETTVLTQVQPTEVPVSSTTTIPPTKPENVELQSIEELEELDKNQLTQKEKEQIASSVQVLIASGITNDVAESLAANPAVLGSISQQQAVQVFEHVDASSISQEMAVEIVDAVQDAPSDVREAFEEVVDLFEGAFDGYKMLNQNITVGERRTVIAAGLLASTATVAMAGGSSPASTGPSQSARQETAARKEEDEEEPSGEIAGDGLDWVKSISIFTYVNGVKVMNWKAFFKKFSYGLMNMGFTIAGSLIVYLTLSGPIQKIAGISTVVAVIAAMWLHMKEPDTE